MKTYLVGGAVRDTLLNYSFVERDWVVVGATVKDMLAAGFKQVGKDFPVFLHPKSKEEYALARKERKNGPGYYGFFCDFDPNVSLDDDLSRRDLTINAIAMDESGQIIDPYGGVDDINNKILRHVSPAFKEDPVRILRVARFAARYYHLGFKLADETWALMYEMVSNDEISHLVAERVWQEWQRSLSEKDPQVFIQMLRSVGALAKIIPELNNLFGIPNSPNWHPEIDSGLHSLLSLKAIGKVTPNPILRFAALMHDVGKATTAMQSWPKHPNHEEQGIGIINALSVRLRIPREYRDFAVLCSKFHLTIHQLYELDSEKVIQLFEKTDAFRRPELFEHLLIVAAADANGCGIERAYQQAEDWLKLRNVANTIQARDIIKSGYSGRAVKAQLTKQRTEVITPLFKTLGKK